MRHLAPILLAAITVVGCRTSTPTNTKPDGLVEPEAPELETQWLVWTTSDSGPKTKLIRGIDGGHETIGEIDGAFIGAPEGEKAKIWEFDTELIETKQTDCDCAMEAFNRGEQDPDCEVESELEIGVLRAFPTGPVMNIPSLDTIDSDTRSVYATIDGNVGPYVFTTMCLERYACGAAHGDQLCVQRIYDLRTMREIDIWDMAADPLRGPDMLSFVQEAYEDEHEAAELAEEDVVFTWVAPRYESSLMPRMEEQYTGPSCYACSDGLWDSYTISVRRTVDELPTLIGAWLKSTPAPPKSSVAEIETRIGGWSPVPDDPALREHLRSAMVQ